MIPAQSHQARLGIGTSLPVSAGLEFVRETLRKTPAVLDTAGLCGSRGRPVERTRPGPCRVAGEVVFHPSPSDLELLLPLLTGSAQQPDGSYPLAETLPETHVVIDRAAAVFTYSGCKVSRARFRGRRGKPIELRINLEGKTETIESAGTFPLLPLHLGPPYVFSAATLTIDAAEYDFQEVEVVIDHHLDATRWVNSLGRSRLSETDRTVLVRLAMPFSSGAAPLLALGAVSRPVVVAFANGPAELRLDFPAVQFPAESPTVASAGEIALLLSGQARKSGAALEATISRV